MIFFKDKIKKYARRFGLPYKNGLVGFAEGFTLVETIVATFVFISIIGIVAGVFVQQIRLNRVAVAMITVNDAMGLTLEQISREVRTGHNFCTPVNVLTTVDSDVAEQCAKMAEDVDGPDQIIQFVNSQYKTVRYRLHKDAGDAYGAIERGVDLDNSPGACDNVGNDDGFISVDGRFCYQRITSENVYVDKLNTIVRYNNQDGTELHPPRITLNMSLTSNERDVKRYGIFSNIQLSLSARNF